MRLFFSATSPYVRKVMLVLHETGQIGEVELVSASGTPLDSSKMPLAQNPLGKVPVLERPDGPALYDSRVICQYLSHRAGAALYPAPPALWSTLTLEATGDGILDAALAMVYEHRLRPPDRQIADLVEGYWAKIERAIDALESRWMGHLSGRLDAGQIAVGAALGYLDLRHDARNWRGRAAALADWYARFSARPSMQATLPQA
ncbi:MAG: glutathione S-transferase [Rhodobacteraceae bacterium]|nr:glutathione S-transferase [Paracoccaceae bacterium]